MPARRTQKRPRSPSSTVWMDRSNCDSSQRESFAVNCLARRTALCSGHAVRASLNVSGKRDYSKPIPTSFSAATFESKTDGEGKYTLTGLPCEVTLNLLADSIDGSDQDKYLDKFYLVPNESRPPAVSRLWETGNEDLVRRALRENPARLPPVTFPRHGHSVPTVG